MIRTVTVLIFVSFLFDSCDSQNEETVNSDSGTFKQSEILDTCLCNDLDEDSLGNHLMKEELYTGICVEYYPGTETKYIEKSLLDGKMHGQMILYDKQGEKLAEETYEEGIKKRDGEVEILNCDCSELVQNKTSVPGVGTVFFLDDIPYTGTCNSYYPETDIKYMEINYKSGVPDGRTYYYDKEGSVLYIENYENGELIGTIY
jgi:hypothetical protein